MFCCSKLHAGTCELSMSVKLWSAGQEVGSFVLVWTIYIYIQSHIFVIAVVRAFFLGGGLGEAERKPHAKQLFFLQSSTSPK